MFAIKTKIAGKKFNGVAQIMLLALITILSACETPPPVAVNLITYGQTVIGKLGSAESDFVFVGGGGDTIDIQCTTDGKPFLVIVLDSKSAVLAKTSGQLTLPATGQYILVVGAGTGDYSLSLKLVSAGSSTPGASLNAALPASPTQSPLPRTSIPTLQISTFTAPAPVTSITTVPTAPASSPFGPLIGGPAVTPFPNNTATLIPTNGPVSITSAPVNTATANPSSTAIPMIGATSGAQILTGQTVIAKIAGAGQTDRYIYFGPANSIITIGMFQESGGSLIPAFDVYAPDGSKLGSAGGTVKTPQAVLSGVILPATGAYIIFPRSVSGTGPYSLTIGPSWTLREVGGGPLQVNQPSEGNLPRIGDRETWIVLLQANSLITITASPNNSKVDPVIELITPDGSRLATAHDFSAANAAKIVNLRINQTGQYKILITAYANGSTGAYKLLVQVPG